LLRKVAVQRSDEVDDADRQEQRNRGDPSRAAPFDVFERQQAGPEHQRAQRAPDTTVEIGRPLGELAQKVAETPVTLDETLLAAGLAIGADQGRAAIRTVRHASPSGIERRSLSQ